jgi:hypothetical protein
MEEGMFQGTARWNSRGGELREDGGGGGGGGGGNSVKNWNQYVYIPCVKMLRFMYIFKS